MEEYKVDQNTWTTNAFQLIQSRQGAAGVAVPAHWFNHLPGGCIGIK